jgi:hypothetical protein
MDAVPGGGGGGGGTADERRGGRRAGAVAFVAVAASVAAIGLERSGSGIRVAEPGSAVPDASDVDRQRELLDLAAHADVHALAVGLKGVGLLLCIPVGLYLVGLVRRRGGSVPAWVMPSLVAGAVLVTAATVLRHLALKDVAEAYVAAGGRGAARAADAIDASDTVTAAVLFELVARIVFAVWLGLLSLAAMRAGLLTSFLGYWGLAAAGGYVVLPIGDAMFLSWLVSIAFLAVGYWPGGRPEAWERRVAVDGVSSEDR